MEKDNAPIQLHPPKWRETCDPFSLPFQRFHLQEVLGYPHAGNDVFYVRGEYDGREVPAYLKAARRKDAALKREAEVLTQLDGDIYPRVLEADWEHGAFLLTQALPGQRLSVIAGENEDLRSLAYMEAYGEALGRLHTLPVKTGEQQDRKFYHSPSQALLEKLGLKDLAPFFARRPEGGKRVFCHGDFHYANVLWEGHALSAVLDFELSGYGDRDFDIAWAIFLRPGQRFLKTEKETEAFLNGYKKQGDCSAEAVRYYMAQCYVYFLEACGEDEAYAAWIRQWLRFCL